MSENKKLSEVVEFLSGIEIGEESLLSVYSDKNHATGELSFNIHIHSMESFIKTFPEHSMEPNAYSYWDTKLSFRVENAVFFTLTSRGEYVRALSHQKSATK